MSEKPANQANQDTHLTNPLPDKINERDTTPGNFKSSTRTVLYLLGTVYEFSPKKSRIDASEASHVYRKADFWSINKKLNF